MSNKSLFDKLFNEVMDSSDDASALDIDSSSDSSLGDTGSDAGEESFGGDEDEGGGDEVTFTLDRATAEKLKEVLEAALGGGFGEEEGDEEGEEDLGEFGGEEGSEEGEEEEGGSFGESPAVETLEELPTQKYVDAMTGKNNKVQGALAGKTNAHGEGNGEVTRAHPLKKASLSYVDGKGKSNVVNSDKYNQQNSKTSSYLTQ